MLPIVSVVVPVLNRVKYVREAVESVMAQSYPNIDLVVVDGGSSDGTRSVLASMGVDYHSFDGKGVSRARNYAVSVAEGAYVCGCDSDDVMHPRYVERLVSAFSDLDVGFVWASCRYIGAKSGVSIARKIYFPLQAYRHAGGVLGPGMFRKDVFKAVGGYRSDLLLGEDYDLLIRISKRWKCVALPDILYDYRIHDDQLMNVDIATNFTERELFKIHPMCRYVRYADMWFQRAIHPKRSARNLWRKVVKPPPSDDVYVGRLYS